METRLETADTERGKKEKELEGELAVKKLDLKEKLSNKEQLELALSEVDIVHKQKVASVGDTTGVERSRVEELNNTIINLVKNLHKFSVLSEDEYLKLMEYEVTDF